MQLHHPFSRQIMHVFPRTHEQDQRDLHAYTHDLNTCFDLLNHTKAAGLN